MPGEVRDRFWGAAETAEWSKVAQRHATTPFSTPEYLGILHTTCNGDEGGCAPAGRLQLILARRSHGVVGALPLARRPGRRAQVFAAPDDIEMALVAADPTAAVELMSEALSRSPGGLRLLSTEGSLDVWALTRAAEQRGRHVSVTRRGTSTHIDVPTGFEDYMSSRSRGLRKDLRRRRRRLEEAGHAEFICTTDVAPDSPLLTEAFRLEDRGWKGRRGSSISARPHVERYYRQLAELASAQGTLRLFALRIEGELVAFDMCLERERRLWFLKGAYDEEWKHVSPGAQLIHHVIRESCAAGVTRFEFMGSNEPYKRRWATGGRTGVVCTAHPPGPAGWADRIGRAAVRRYRQKARQGGAGRQEGA